MDVSVLIANPQINNHLRKLLTEPTNHSIKLSLSFLKCLVDYEHYIPLCVPLETSVDSAETVKLKFW